MAPPSPSPAPEKEKQLSALLKQIHVDRVSRAKTDEREQQHRQQQQRRRSLTPRAPSPERPRTSYSQQFQRRKSQQEMPMENSESRKPSSNGSKSQPRNELADGDPPLNGLHSSDDQEQSADSAMNGARVETVGDVVDASSSDASAGEGLETKTVDKTTTILTTQTTTTERIVVDSSLTKPAVSKKRKAPCGRSTVALVTGVGLAASMTSGVAVCRMYPTSPAAIWIFLAKDRVLAYLHYVFKEIWAVVNTHCQSFLKTKTLVEAATALKSIVTEDVDSALHFFLERLQHVRDQLNPVASLTQLWSSTFALTWDRLKDVVDLELGGDNWWPEEVQSRLDAVLTVLQEAVDPVMAWMQLRVNNLLELIDFEPKADRVEETKDQLLSPRDLSSLQNVRKGVVAKEEELLLQVQRSEKSRVASTAVTDTRIAGTQAVVSTTVGEFKPAAMEHIEALKKRLAKEYLEAIEQELTEFERTSKQMMELGFSSVAAVNRVEVDAATRLRQELKLSIGAADTTAMDEEPGSGSDMKDDISDDDDSAEVLQNLSDENQPTSWQPSLQEVSPNAVDTNDVLAELGEIAADVKHIVDEVVGLSLTESVTQDQDDEQDEATAQTPEIPENELKVELAIDTIENFDEEQADLDADLNSASWKEEESAEKSTAYTEPATENANIFDVDRNDAEVKDTETVHNANIPRVEVEEAVEKDHHAEETEIVDVLDDVEAAIETLKQDIQDSFASGGAPEVDSSEAKESGSLSSGIETLEDNTPAVEVQDEKSEESRIEQELLLIAEVEGIHLQTQEPDTNAQLVLKVETIQVTTVVADSDVVPEVGGPQANVNSSSLVDMHSNAWLQAGLAVVSLLVFSGAAALLFVRHPKRGQHDHGYRRRRRKPLEEIEEVVLMSDVSSDDEAAETGESKDDVEADEPVPSGDVDGVVDASFEGDGEQETSEKYDGEGKGDNAEDSTPHTEEEIDVVFNAQGPETNSVKDSPDSSGSEASPTEASDIHDSQSSAEASEAGAASEGESTNDTLGMLDIAHRTRGRLRKFS